MLERGGFSFVALLVINPIAILLYQNCTFLPVAHSELALKQPVAQKRVISSVAHPTKIDMEKKVAHPQETSCQNSPAAACPVSTVE